MSFEAELKTHYSEIHRRLSPPPPRYQHVAPTPRPEPPPPPVSLPPSPLSTAKLSKPEAIYNSEAGLRRLLAKVAEWEDIRICDLQNSRQHDRKAIKARFVFYYLAYEFTTASLLTVGRVARKDHTTVLYGLRRLGELRAKDPDLDARVSSYEAELSTLSTRKVFCCPLCGHPQDGKG